MRRVLCCRPIRLPENTLVDVPGKEVINPSATSLRTGIFHALSIVGCGSVFLTRQLNLASQNHQPVAVLDRQISAFRRVCRLTFTVSITERQFLVPFEKQIDPLGDIASKLPLVQTLISLCSADLPWFSVLNASSRSNAIRVIVALPMLTSNPYSSQ